MARVAPGRGAGAVLTRALPLLLTLGCAPLPALITDAQVRAVLPAHVEAGTRCAARLNGHVRAARASGVARPIVAGSGALLGAVGAVLRESDAALPLAVTGAALAVVAELVLRLVADPAVLLAAHGRGLASWDAARGDAGGAADHLERCVRDEAPARSRLPLLGGRAP